MPDQTKPMEIGLADGGMLVTHRGGTGHPALLLHGGPGLSDYMGQLADEPDFPWLEQPGELRRIVERFVG